MHHYTESGLDNVWLKNGYQYDNNNLYLEDKWNLHYTIASELINKQGKLLPHEFKYFRNELEATQATLANALGVCESTIRNWETGRCEISPIADRMIRLTYRSCVNDKVDLLDLINSLALTNESTGKIELSYSNYWHSYF